MLTIRTKRLASLQEKRNLNCNDANWDSNFEINIIRRSRTGHAVPHFIGVWDTVAADGLSPPVWAAIKVGLIVFAVCLASTFAWFETRSFNLQFLGNFVAVLVAFAVLGLATNVLLRLKFVTDLPGHKWYETLHLTGLKMEFFDKSLNRNVRYARHALAIDE